MSNWTILCICICLSVMYFARLESTMTVTYFLYFGYMAVICLGIFLITGKIIVQLLISDGSNCQKK